MILVISFLGVSCDFFKIIYYKYICGNRNLVLPCDPFKFQLLTRYVCEHLLGSSYFLYLWVCFVAGGALVIVFIHNRNRHYGKVLFNLCKLSNI